MIQKQIYGPNEEKNDPNNKYIIQTTHKPSKDKVPRALSSTPTTITPQPSISSLPLSPVNKSAD